MRAAADSRVAIHVMKIDLQRTHGVVWCLCMLVERIVERESLSLHSANNARQEVVQTEQLGVLIAALVARQIVAVHSPIAWPWYSAKSVKELNPERNVRIQSRGQGKCRSV